jgi:hypothetical protein
MAVTEYAYTSVEAVAALLAAPGQLVTVAADPDARPVLLRLIQSASARINAHCGRVFTPTTLTAILDAPPPPSPTRYTGGGWDAAGARIAVPDLQSVTSLTAFGTTLTADTDYQIVRYRNPDGTPGRTYLLRLAAGVARSWYYNVTGPWQPLGAVALTGVFAYDATDVPSTIVEVTEALVLKGWARRLRLYNTRNENGETVDSTTLDKDLQARLTPFVLRTDPVFA